jgi:hypothetical protein
MIEEEGNVAVGIIIGLGMGLLLWVSIIQVCIEVVLR